MADRPSPTDHPFEPIGEWWSLCMHCGLARAAHNAATPESIEAMQAHFATLPRAKSPIPRFTEPVVHPGGRTQIGHYVSDDDDD